VVQIDVDGPHSVQAGDVFLLCSDGLSGQVTDPEMGAVLSVLPPAEACQFLIDLANLRGGPDNITALVVRVTSGPEANGAAPRKEHHLPHPPWWLNTLAAGVTLAAVAAALEVNAWPGGGFMVLLASAAIPAGLAGLVLHYRQERKKQADDEDRPAPAPPVHRRAACRIEAPLLERLARAVTILKQRAEENHWAPDWSAYEEHFALAQRLQASGDLPGAFREYCRAMLPLSRHRKKEEVFQPIWDKHVENGRRKIDPSKLGR